LLIDARLLGSGAARALRELISSAVDLLAIVTHARAGAALSRAGDRHADADRPDRRQPLGPGRRGRPDGHLHRAKAGFALDPEARRLAGRYYVAPIGIPLEAEHGIVPPTANFPRGSLQVNWQEPGGSSEQAEEKQDGNNKRER
jgi:hypothetical protein